MKLESLRTHFIQDSIQIVCHPLGVVEIRKNNAKLCSGMAREEPSNFNAGPYDSYNPPKFVLIIIL